MSYFAFSFLVFASLFQKGFLKHLLIETQVDVIFLLLCFCFVGFVSFGLFNQLFFVGGGGSKLRVATNIFCYHPSVMMFLLLVVFLK